MSDNTRRKLLKSLAAAGGGAFIAGKSLSETWSRPVVDSVLLPAHAQTSQMPAIAIYTASASVGVFVMDTHQGEESRFSSIADSLVPAAYAGGESPSNDGFYICAIVDDQAGTAQVAIGGIGGFYRRFTLYQTDMIRRGTLMTNGDLGQVIAQPSDTTACKEYNEQQRTKPARISGYTPGDTVLRVQMQTGSPNGNQFVEIVAELSANGCLPEPPFGDRCFLPEPP